jgi:regulator of protease activity HflC (stomatin/prohibitin superfamily)
MSVHAAHAISVLFIGAVLGGCASIPTGRTGVEWTPMRGTEAKPLDEGLHLVSPLARVYRVDLREQEGEDSLDVLANNGLDIKLRTSILYQPIASQVYQLITQTGADYYSVLIAPYIRSGARRIVGRYSPEEIYSSKREQIEREILDEVVQKLAGKHVQVDAILIREVHLPEAVQAAIQTKLEEEQKALQMQFVLDRTKQEAVRKHIEAGGISDYQSIISKTLNDQVIEWKGIEATEKLADSPNAKVIIIGSGKNGLPVILNTAGAVTAPQSASARSAERRPGAEEP